MRKADYINDAVYDSSSVECLNIIFEHAISISPSFAFYQNNYGITEAELFFDDEKIHLPELLDKSPKT